MNKIYRIVFNTVTGRWVVASEMAKGRTKASRSAQVGATAALIGALAALPGMSHAAVVVNGNPQEGTVGCDYYQDQVSTTWTYSTSSTYCIVAAGTGASAQGNPGKRAVFYSSDSVNGNEDSLNLGGYLDVWKTATFWGGANMQGTKITGLGAGLVSAASTEAINGGQLFNSNSAIAAAFGGTSTVNAAGNVTAPSYTLTNANTIAGTTGAAGDVGTGFGKVDAALGKLNNNGTRYFKAGGLQDGTDDAVANGNSVAVGAGAKAYGTGSANNPTPYNNTVAIGNNAFTAGGGAVAIGDTANASFTNIAIGAGADASAPRRAMALGINSKVTAYDAVALGGSSVADRANTVSVGSAGAERQIVNVAAGTQDTDAVNVSQLKGVTTALGGGAAVNATTGAVIAPSYALSKANTIAGTTGAAGDVGTGFGKVDAALGALNTTLTSITTGNTGIKYFHVNSGGADSTATGAESIAIGPTANAIGAASIAIGQRATMSATANNGVAIGGDSKAGDKSVSIGNGAATGASTWAVAAGTNATVTGQWGISIGGGSAVAGDSGVTVGTNSRASATNSAALGTAANASAVNSVALGANSTTTANLATAGYNPGSAALAGTASTANGEVSLGSATKERRLTNLAAGSAATDAVNVSQLQAEDATVDKLGTDAAAHLGGTATYDATTGAISAPSYAMTNADGTTTTLVHNVGDAISNLDGRTTTNADAIDALQGTMADAVMYDSAAHDKVTFGTAGTPVQLTNVKAGELSSDSTEAVNGAQLYATNSATAAALGTTVDGNGNIVAPQYTVTNADGTTTTTYNNVAGAVTNIDGRVTTITNQLNSGTVGLVQQATAGANLTVGKDTDGAAVDFADKTGTTRTLKNVTAGVEGSDAVNLSQLTVALGGTVNPDGTVIPPSYDVHDADGNAGTVNNVGDAITNLDSRVYDNTTNISQLQQDALQWSDALGAYDAGHGTALANKITHVGAGTLAVDSTDAVNGSQLYATNSATAAALGTTVDGNGNIVAPQYTVTNADGTTTTTYNNVAGAVTNIDGRVTQNTTDITNITTQLNSGTVGLVQQAAAGANLTVGKDTDGAAVDFAGTTGARKLLNVEDGTVATGSKEAVNGGQLSATNDRVTATESNITTLQGDVTNLDGRVTTAEGNITSLDSRVTTNEGDITNLQTTVNNISSGTVGLVQQAAAGANLTVGKDTDGAAVDFAGTTGARKLLNVEDGTVATGSKEAVNGGQLSATNDRVATAEGNITTLQGDVTTLDGRVTTAEGDITSLDSRVTTNEGDITNLDSRVTTNEGDISTLNTNVSNIDNRVTTAEGNITNLDSRVTTNEGDISTLQTTVNNISSGTVGLVQQAAAGANLTVGKDTDGAAVDFAGTTGARKLLNVEDGTVATGSKEAVNGGQLSATNDRVATAEGNITTLQGDVTTLDGRVTTAEGDITNLDQRVTTNEDDISTLNTNVTNIDNRVTTAEGNITNLDQRVTTNEGDISTLKTDVTNIDGRVTTVEGSVTNLTTQLNNGEVGLVKYDDASGIVSVAADKAGTTVDFRNNGGLARRLKGVAAGADDEDAVNVSQLKTVVDGLGGGASIDPTTGVVTGPTYYVTNTDGSKSEVHNVGDAVTNIDGRTYSNTQQITTINNQLANGEIGLVRQDATTKVVTVAQDKGGTELNIAGTDGERKLTGVADGTVAAGSKDAVNGGQLYGVSSSVAQALGGGSTVDANGNVTAPQYTVTDANGSTSTVTGVEGAVTNLDGRVYQNTQAIANNTTQISNLTTQINSGEVGMVKQAAKGEQLTVGKDTDGTAVNFAGTAGDRTLTGVAAAQADNDAVNLGQLKAAGVVGANGESKTVVTYDNASQTSITMGDSTSGPVTIHNVAQGSADTDAVNVAQLNDRIQRGNAEVVTQANAYTDQRVNDVWTGMDKLATQVARQDRRIDDVGAMSMAEAQMTSNAVAASLGSPNGGWAVGVGMQNGRSAVSAGYARPIGTKSHISFGAAFSGQDQSVGIGFGRSL